MILWPLLAMMLLIALPARATVILPAHQETTAEAPLKNPAAQTLARLALTLQQSPDDATRAATAIELQKMMDDHALWKKDNVLLLVLNDAAARLRHDPSSKALSEAAILLQHAAERVELGPRGEAMRDVEKARKALSSAIDKGRSDADVQPLIESFGNALARFLDTVDVMPVKDTPLPLKTMGESGGLHLDPELPMR